MTDLITQLRNRGFIAQLTDKLLSEHFSERRTIYAGFDPTAESLHVGHIVPVMALAHAQAAGHRPIILVGGGTGLIGDPSGKTVERQLLSKEQVNHNCSTIKEQLAQFLDFSGPNGAIMVNNADWLVPTRLLDFLRDIGKHFSIKTMISRESVRWRLEDREQGISFTEFSYALLQAYDFLHLFREFGCTVQCGGNDQWGNIVGGIDLISRACGKQAFGLTFPLLLTASGTKFGKTESGSVWLDPKRTSPLQLYQFWINTNDADVVRFLNLFTFLPEHRIEELSKAAEGRPEDRAAQRALAHEFTRMVHGNTVTNTVEKVTSILFGDLPDKVDDETLKLLSEEIPCLHLSSADALVSLPLANLILKTGMAASHGAAIRLIESGGIYVNNQRRTDAAARITESDLMGRSAVLLRCGKKNYHLVKA